MDGLASTSIMSGNHSSTSCAERPETITNEDCLSQLPEETLLHIFGYLNHPRELATNAQTSRRWRRLSSDPYLWNTLDLSKTFPHLSIYDASDWEKHFGLSVEDEPPIDNRTLFPILKQFSSLPTEKLIEENGGKRIEQDVGITLLTIPKELTLIKLIDMANDGDKVKFKSIYGGVLRDFGDIEVDETYRILITNNVLEESRNLSVSEQKDLVDKLGCERPKALEVIALLIATFIKSGKRLYSDNPWTYARCLETVDGKYPIVVGGFASNGLGVYCDRFFIRNSGAAALRKV